MAVGLNLSAISTSTDQLIPCPACSPSTPTAEEYVITVPNKAREMPTLPMMMYFQPASKEVFWL